MIFELLPLLSRVIEDIVSQVFREQHGALVLVLRLDGSSRFAISVSLLDDGLDNVDKRRASLEVSKSVTRP